MATADLNKDGWLDLAFSNGAGDELFIYHGSAIEFSESALTKLPTRNSHAVEIDDVDNDGWLDLICPLDKEKVNRSVYSNILLGSEEGYNLDHSTRLPTDGGAGSIVSVFNRGDFQDVFLSPCLRQLR